MVLLLFASVLPRLAALGRYVTPDELVWVLLSVRQRDAIFNQEWAATIQIAQPGVITSWLGAAGIQVQLWLQLWLQPTAAAEIEWIRHLTWLFPEYGEAHQHLAGFLTAGRLMVIAATVLMLLLIYRLGRRHVGPLPAFCGALLLALDPFSAGHAGLLHVDALLGSFILLALLLAAPAGVQSPGLAQEFLAGVVTAFAVLTKLPGGLLVPLIPAMWLAHYIPRRRQHSLARALLIPLTAWCIGGLLAAIIFLPALWADPGHTFDVILRSSAETAIAQEPILFLGRIWSPPWALYYPVAIIYRLSPFALIGLLLALVAGVRQWRRGKRPALPPIIWWGIPFTILFVAGMGLSDRVFDRYVLPVTMLLTLFAGWHLGQRLGNLPERRRQQATWIGLAATGLYALVHWATPMSAYNWLLGGPWLAQHAMPLGWGEGVSAAARQAATTAVQTGEEATRLFTTSVPAAAPFFPGEVILLTDVVLGEIRPQDFVVYGVSYIQTHPDQFDPNAGKWPGNIDAEHTSDFLGVEQARLYPGFGAEQLGAAALEMTRHNLLFGGVAMLQDAGIAVHAVQNTLRIGAIWQSQSDTGGTVQWTISGEQDISRVSIEEPLTSRAGVGAAHWPPGDPTETRYRIALPWDMPPGEYELYLSVFDAVGERQGVFDTEGQFAGVQPFIASFHWPAVTPQSAPEEYDLLSADAAMARLGPLPEQIGTGEVLALDLWWRKRAGDPATGSLMLEIGGDLLPASIDTREWPLGNTYHIQPKWQIPAFAIPGSYQIRLHYQDEAGSTVWSFDEGLGGIIVEARERNYTLPEDIEPLGIQATATALLQHLDAVVVGDQLQLRFVWQAAESTGTNYTIFIHLKDDAGNILDNGDRPPGIPTDAWVPGQIIDDTFVFTAPPGLAAVTAGLYDPATGARLPLYDTDGAALPDQQYTIPVPDSSQ